VRGDDGHHQDGGQYAPITLAPLAWLAVVTMTAGYQKIFSPDPKLGFLARANLYDSTLAAGNLPPGIPSTEVAQRFIVNDRIDAAVAAFFMISVIIIIADSAKEWYKVVSGRMPAVSTEVPFEPRAAVAGD
jgi:carbon starvation protein